MPGIWDHLLLGLLMVVLPIWGMRESTEHPRARWKRSRAERRRTMIWIIALQWVSLGLMLTIWLGSGRDFADLNLTGPLHWRFWLGLGMCAATIGLLFVQHRSALKDETQRPELAQLLDRRAAFLPRSRVEIPLLIAVCISAGVCEEFIYRGWMFWYLSSYFGTSVIAWVGVVIAAAVIFAVGHSYQDKRGMAEVFGAALIFGGLYMLMDSLWVAMILHFALDLNGGLLAAKVHSDAPTRPSSASVEATQRMAPT